MLRQLAPIALATLAPLAAGMPAAQAASTSAESASATHAVAGLALTRPGPARLAATEPNPPENRRVLDVAHRGASAQAPENTMAAFRAARDRGADVLELDVQETKDHKLVVMHDTTLGRTTNAERIFPGKSPWRVRDLTLAQIRKLDAGSWYGSAYKGQRVPTLARTLRDMQDSGMDLLLEVKSPSLYPGIGDRVADELRRHGNWLNKDRVIVQSFDWPFVREFHKRLPNVPTGLLGTPPTSDLAAAAKYADYINPPHKDVTPGYVRKVHKRGMKVIPWTVNDAPTMRRLIRNGADGIITNRPGTLREVNGG
ncbi:glycerophosphodiester phosphodiesterase [Actinomadura sp. HBU206391]|uniref:glycerophosphodiester phosphodiesterase n=1 Tax=Actinomadura sp. HBU206391 TaxID=2731692 RepID=UPI0016502C6B|nr:glycerophosphodiester phosphodiesterase family protein [Actinomadura sp. HBU206391]MBC6462750.1 glycerophosphodiester phosphodiesterase [Actinomadura sp. HBU206391]